MGYYSWQDLPSKTVSEFRSHRSFKGEKIRVLLQIFKPGHIGEKHKHQSEQISHILKGRIKLTIDEEERIVKAGDLIHIPENQIHQIKSVEEEAIILEIFSPSEYQVLTCD